MPINTSDSSALLVLFTITRTFHKAKIALEVLTGDAIGIQVIIVVQPIQNFLWSIVVAALIKSAGRTIDK
jgi:hypothetical protein